MRPSLPRALVTVLASALIFTTSAGPVAATPPDLAPADTISTAGTAGATPITLLTGDQMYADGPGSVGIVRGPGREQITFRTEERDGELFVIPGDVRGHLAEGSLDERLFNITLLQESGYDDARADLPLIVTHQPGAAGTARSAVRGDGVRLTASLPAADALALRVDKAELAGFWQEIAVDGTVAAISLDGLRQPALAESVPQVGAPAAWDAGLDGAGVTVAVLDTGYDETHPDLADQVVASRNFTAEPDTDENGHGTHVASTVAGTGAASDGVSRGVAPGAQLLIGKVCGNDGCPESAILGGMQWAAEQGAAVVNMSLGGPDRLGIDPLEAAVDRLTDEFGTLFVVASGNDGDDATVNSPASADAALAVGAVDKADQLAWFSSRGPRVDGALKPELTAPGAAIVAAIPGGGYGSADGTSMATPHVAGAAAILAQQHPEWSPARLKAALTGSAQPHPEITVGGQGAGRLDVGAAIDQSVVAEPAAVSFTRQTWPHEEQEVRTVSFHNHGSETASFELSLHALDPAGQPAPAELFSLSEPAVTVPAGGVARVEITVDPAGQELTGYLGGQLSAVDPAGGARVVVPFGVELEVESFDVTLVHTDRAGAPADDYETVLVGPLDGQDVVRIAGEAPTVTVRVPAGDFFLYSWVVMVDADGVEQWTTLVHPRLSVDRDQTVELDAALAEPIRVTTQGRDTTMAYVSAFAQFRTGQWTRSVNTTAVSEDGLYTAQLGPERSEPYLTTAVRGAWAVPGRDGRIESAAEMYYLADFLDGYFPTGYERQLLRRELATVRADYGAQLPDSRVLKLNSGVRLEPFVGASTPYLPLAAPLARTEYFTTGESLQWRPAVLDELPTGPDLPADPLLQLGGEPVVYQPGRPYQQQWNYGAFGPALTPDRTGVQRDGDRLVIAAELFSDRAGHHSTVQGTGMVTVARDGELLAERLWLPGLNPVVAVPPEPADYRVTVTASRFGPSPFATEVNVAWTVTSEYAAGPPVQLPTSVVRFAPPVDGMNSAPAGQHVIVPFTVESPLGSGGSPVVSKLVEVSYDDGERWQRVPLRPGVTDRAVVTHPSGSGFVSLRATMTDQQGNTVEQTILRAYRYGS